ncbi:MAG TPA: VOC family protein [Thermoanaerobaculia bacterium]|nr:VOC family protein [Thermoanaerobaculia bacterium]
MTPAYDVYVRTEDVAGLAAELKERGAHVVEGPADREYGMRELVVADCNGLVIAFGEEIA